MKKIALLILIFVNLGFCEFSLEGKVNDIVSRVESCKVYNKNKTLGNPLFKDLKIAIANTTKRGFINSSSIVSFRCTKGSVRGEFNLVQKGNSIFFEFYGLDDIREGSIIEFRLAALNGSDKKENNYSDNDLLYGWYRISDENNIVTEEYETDAGDSFEGLKITIMDSYKILKGAVK